MRLKIFNSNDSNIKLSFDGFKQQYWLLRSASSIYSYGIPGINFWGISLVQVSSEFMTRSMTCVLRQFA